MALDKNHLGFHFCSFTQKPAHVVRVSGFRRFNKLHIQCSGLLGRMMSETDEISESTWKMHATQGNL
jgi:hypothetical protein